MGQVGQELLTWADILKLLAGFAISLVLIWARNEGLRLHRRKVLKRSAWNVAKHHTTFRDLLEDLESTCKYAKEGKVWVSSVDLSRHYSSIISDLSKLDPKNSSIYVSLLSAEEVVRKGYEHLRILRLEFIKARTAVPCPPDEAQSIRSAMEGQCSSIKKDLKSMARRELELLKLIEIRKTDAVNPIKKLEDAISRLDA